MVVRIRKGFFMFCMFFLFAVGILLELVLILPVIIVLEWFTSYKPFRMQNTHRFFFVIWLGLMRAGGLLMAKSAKGYCYEGPGIIIANHPGLFDVLYLIRDIPKLTVMVKRSLAIWLPLGSIFKSSGYILSPEGSSANPMISLLDAMAKLSAGYKFLLFPEGTRSPKGSLGKFKAGAFKIAQKQGVPVQPVLIYNDPPFLPKGEPWYLPTKEISEIQIEFMDPIHIPKEKNIRDVVKEVENLYYRALKQRDGWRGRNE
jgi:1-acyl-sn-glycerol-3-phosphate acyltransferase